MSEGKNLADHLCPPWHAAERKHETREQDRREKDEEGHLYSLQLVFSDRGKRDAHREVCDDEDKCYQQQEKNAALHRYVKEKIGRDQDDRYLDVADEYVWHNFSDEHFTGFHVSVPGHATVGTNGRRGFSPHSFFAHRSRHSLEGQQRHRCQPPALADRALRCDCSSDRYKALPPDTGLNGIATERNQL